MGGILTEEELKAQYYNRKCKECGRAGTWLGDICLDCLRVREIKQEGDMWSRYVLRMVETVPEFRERLRKALGVKP